MTKEQKNSIPAQDIDVDRAWGELYSRLQKENLLSENSSRHETLNYRKRLFIARWAAVAAILMGCALSVYMLSKKTSSSLLLIENQDSESSLVTTLNDGSVVFLAKGSSIQLPEEFATNQRLVSFKGEALFDINKDANRPFIIETSDVLVEVVGTTFSIKSDVASFFELSVKEGKVRVTEKTSQKQSFVEAGEIVSLQNGMFSKNSNRSNIITTYAENIRFKDENLGNIVQVINNLSDEHIVLTNNSLNSRMLTVTFHNNSTLSKASLICMALNLKQSVSNDTIYISQP